VSRRRWQGGGWGGCALAGALAATLVASTKAAPAARLGGQSRDKGKQGEIGRQQLQVVGTKVSREGKLGITKGKNISSASRHLGLGRYYNLEPRVL
jgi:NADPH-dependent 2,4-dienoyl-CoA reductase/sulfur reductase-like enzyme